MSAIGLGAVAGIRSMTPPALLSRAASRGEIEGIEGSPFGFLASPRVANLLTVLALGEILADKLPFSPDRISAPGLAGRLATGALVGAALFSADGRRGASGGAIGALSSLAASYLSYYARTGTQQRFGLPNPAGGILEDMVALSIGLLSLRRSARA
ncbi:MAG: DUF4126 family protein [Actinomycetota bacterium]|nr:DUF4126 family protein [Actinomycetota bacterium]